MTAPSVSCAACQTTNPAAARFCMSCGESLEIACPSCETALPPAAKFCFSCGHEIVAGATAADTGQTAEAVTSTIATHLAKITAGAGERRTITMLFCDIADSTATAERMDPEAWSEILRAAMDCFVGSVERYGGTVARLLGDAILAYFGAPAAHEDDPQRALLAALAIRDCTAELRGEVQARHGTNFDIRIGINTGLVIVGAVGSERFSEYAALGDAANVAARMEQTADLGTIRIAEPTYRLVAPLFDFDPVGAVQVKGKSEPVEAFTVLRARGTPGQVRGIEGLTSPLVGRAEELRRLREALAALTAGSGQVASVMGEAGLGKSRLVAELRSEAGGGIHWISGQCYSYEDTTPYAPFIPALNDCLELGDVAEPAERTAKVIASFAELLGPAAGDQALYACTLLGLPLTGDDQRLLDYIDPATLRGRVFAAVGDLLEALAAREPVVLELEDLHWADPTSIDLVEHLLPLANRARILFLLLFRPRRDEPSWHIHELAARELAHRHTEVALSPLDADDARDLVANLLKVEGLRDSVRHTILDKAEGNPFFVEEVIRSLLDAGVILREGDRFVATEDIDDIAVPDTLAAVLSTRLDQLSADARHVAQTASVLGREFSLEMLRMLVDDRIDLAATMTQLQQRELIVERRRDPDVILTFKHALTRDTAYDTLLHAVRRDLHRIVGTLVEELHPERVFELAWHFAEADEPTRALPYLVAAGEQSFGAFACADAARYFRRALQLWDETQDPTLARRAYEGLGHALMFLGEMPAAIRNFEDMLVHARANDDVSSEISALNKGGLFTLMGTGDTAAAEAKMLEAKAIAERVDEREGVAEFHLGYCYLNVSRGDLDNAERHLGEAAEVCFVLDPHSRNFGLLHYAEALIYQTRFDEARPALTRAREQAELDQDLDYMAQGLAAEALFALYIGEPTRGSQMAAEAIELGRRIGSSLAVALALAWAGQSAYQLGDLERAQVLLDELVEIGPPIGITGGAAAGLVKLAQVEQWLRGPGTERAGELFADATAMVGEPLGTLNATDTLASLGMARLTTGELDLAEKALVEARRIPSAFTKLHWPEVLICGGGIDLARGDLASGSAKLREAAELVESTGLDLFRGRALLGLAMVASTDGDAERMRRLLHDAEDDAAGRLQRMDAILIQRTGASLLEGAGLADDAAGFRERAGDMIAEVAARISSAETRRDFLRTNMLVG